MNNRLVFSLAVIFLVVLLSGCENLPFSMPGMKHKSRATWKTRDFPFSSILPIEITLRSKEDLIGNVTLDQKLYDGYQFGNLAFRPRNGTIVRIEKCWEDKLVELTQITWPNGESWLLFVWDHGKDVHLRTISIFDPRIQELFSLELDFGNSENSEVKTVKYRYSWKMSLPIYAKYLNFLEKVKFSYSDSRTWDSETRGRWFRVGRVSPPAKVPIHHPVGQVKPLPGAASLTFKLSRDFLPDCFVTTSEKE